MTIFGWDASDFDWPRGPMNLDAAVQDGITFFTHKATEGTRTQHIHYGEALNRAKAAGMPFVGAYIVPRTPGNNGHGTIQEQVNYFLAYLDQETPWWWTDPTFFLQVDTEHWGYDDVAPQHGAQAATFLRAQTGKTVLHYAPRWAYGDSIPGDEPLWASAYGTNPAVPYRQAYPGDGSDAWAPYSGRTPTILQYGSKLTIGIQPGCDGNAYRGTIEQFRALITGGKDMSLTPDQETELLRNVHNADWGVTQLLQGSDPAAGFIQHGGTEFTVPNKLHQTLAEIKTAIKALSGTPASVTMSDADRKAIVDALVAHPDTPLGDADKPAIASALDEFFAKHFGPVSAPAPKMAATSAPEPTPPPAGEPAEPATEPTPDPDDDGDPATGAPGTAPASAAPTA